MTPESSLATSTVSSPEPELVLISQENRRDRDGDQQQAGGWGPHLRSVLSGPGGDLWFVHDLGNDVLRNEGLRYLRRVDGSWIQSSSIDFDLHVGKIGGKIQQNLASVMIGTVIHSFGVDVERRRLIECTFNTLSAESVRCEDVEVSGRPLELNERPNYVGAALLPNGYPVVWWTTTGTVSKSGTVTSAGKLYHLWRFGGGWNGPVETELTVGGRPYLNFGYARPSVGGRHRLELLGELELPKSVKRAVHATINIDAGYRPAELTVFDAARSQLAEDVWVDGEGGLHAITSTTTLANAGFYYYKKPGGRWRFIQSLPGLTVVRFQEDSRSAMLHLLADEAGRVVLRSGSVKDHAGPLDLDSFVMTPIDKWPPKTDLSQPNAIYNMSRAYQTRDALGLHFGLIGRSPGSDNRIVYLGQD